MEIRLADGKRWYFLARVDDHPKQSAKRIILNGQIIGLFRTIDDQFFAIHDQCPHRQGPLSEGLIHSRYVTCPLHDWTIDLASGKSLEPDVGQVACFPVIVDNGEIWLGIDQHDKGEANDDTF